MSTTNDELILAPTTNVPGLFTDDGGEALKAVSKTADYLCRIQLFSGKSKSCERGLVMPGNYGIVRSKDNIESLGKEVDCIVVNGRSKALQVCKDGTIIVKHDHTDPEFARIAETSLQKNSGCMFGPEFLIYLPKQDEFVTFFLSSKSARNVSDEFFARRGKKATLFVEFVDKKFSWHVPHAKPCSSVFNVPTPEQVDKAIAKFVAQKDTDAELVEEEAGGSGGRAR